MCDVIGRVICFRYGARSGKKLAEQETADNICSVIAYMFARTLDHFIHPFLSTVSSALTYPSWGASEANVTSIGKFS